jgi:hypothetical protein
MAAVGVGTGVQETDRYDVRRVGGGSGGGGGAYALRWTNPADESANSGAALSDCDSESCTWDVGASGDDELTLNATLSPEFEGVALNYAVNDESVATLSATNGNTGPNGADTVDITAQNNGRVSVLTSANDGSDVIRIDVTGVDPDPGPPGQLAYDDANQNGQYDTGETTYTKTELQNGFDDATVDLVIPSDVGTISSNSISITANSITSSSDLEATNGNLYLEATGGQLDVRDQYLATQNGGPSLIASGNLLVDGAQISGGQTLLEGGSVSAVGAVVEAVNAELTINSDDTIDATGASLTSTTNDLALDSGADMYLQNSAISAPNGDATANVGGGSDTFYVEGMTIDDRDNTLDVSPNGAAVEGNPESGTTE